MDKICRLCLKVSDDMACKLGQNTNIKLCCLIIELHNSLPNNICSKCYNMLVNIESFRENVIQNENKLKELINNGSNMNEFYDNIKNQYINAENFVKIEKEDERIDICYPDLFHEDSLLSENIEQSGVSNNMENLHDNYVYNSELSQNYHNQKICYAKSQLKKRWKKKKTPYFNPNKNKKIVQEKRLVNNETNILDNIKTDLPPKDLDKKPVELNDNERNVSDMKPDLSLNISDETPVGLNDNEPKVIKIDAGNIEVTINTCLTCLKNHTSRKQLIKHYRTEHSSQINKIKNESDELNPTATTVKKEAVKDDSYNKNVVEPKKRKSENPCYFCKICGCTYINLGSLVRHGRAHGNNAFQCSHGCGYVTVYKGALKQHEKLHTKDFNYKCEICGAGFDVKSWHDQHQNVHNKIKPYVCDLCGKTFSMERYLQRHRTTMHPELSEKHRFTCPFCHNGFSNKGSFRNHMEIHNGKRKFLCDICGKEFASKELLKYHNNSHFGVKPFTCSICNKKFAKKFNLTVHERAHAGERHLCQICGKYFVQRSTLLRHTRQFHANNENTHNKNIRDTEKFEDTKQGPGIKRDENGQEHKLLVLSTNNFTKI